MEQFKIFRRLSDEDWYQINVSELLQTAAPYYSCLLFEGYDDANHIMRKSHTAIGEIYLAATKFLNGEK
jgi:hypothetical protein